MNSRYPGRKKREEGKQNVYMDGWSIYKLSMLCHGHFESNPDQFISILKFARLISAIVYFYHAPHQHEHEAVRGQDAS